MQPLTTKWKLFAVSLLSGLLGSGLLLLVLAEFHEEITEPFLMHMDLQIQAAVHAYTSVALTRVMLGLTWIGSPTVLFPSAALIAALFWWRRLHRDTVVFLIAMMGAGFLNTALKLHFRRARPDLPWALVQEHSFSFPSGHSVFAVVLYGILVYLALRHLRHAWERAAVIVGVVALISGIGLSRIYLGVHYPSDVAAGYFVGCIWLMTVMGSDWSVRRMAVPRQILGGRNAPA
jgi:membrane-associated phospholipid phosphatase